MGSRWGWGWGGGWGIEICHPERELCGLRKDFNIGWFVCFLEILANCWQGFLLGPQNKGGNQMGRRPAQSLIYTRGSNTQGGWDGHWVFIPSSMVLMTTELLSF